MNEYDELNPYNGDVAHDINVDYDRFMHIGVGAELLEETNLNDFVNNIKNWV